MASQVKTESRKASSSIATGKRLKKKKFKDVAFGLLKNTFGKRSSVNYVASLRKEWR